MFTDMYKMRTGIVNSSRFKRNVALLYFFVQRDNKFFHSKQEPYNREVS